MSKIIENGHRDLLPSICTNGEMLWNNKEILFKNLDFCDKIESDIEQVRDKNKIKEVLSSLELLENYCSELWELQTPFDKNLINSDITKESNSNLKEKPKLYNIVCPDKKQENFLGISN